jgi:hypothetical protein
MAALLISQILQAETSLVSFKLLIPLEAKDPFEIGFL